MKTILKKEDLSFKSFLPKTGLLVMIIFLAAACNPFQKVPVAGLNKTTNGGADWQAINTIADNQGSLAPLNVARMDFDPFNHEIVFASGFNDGLYKSEDSGGTWRRVLSRIWTFDFVISPINSNTIYAGGFFADVGRLVKTEDGGKSWQEVYSEAAPSVSVRAVAVDPTSPNHVVIGTSAGGFIKSNDGGLSWKLLKNFNDRINRIYWLNEQVYVLVKGKGLFKSTNLDAGEFVELTESLTKSDNFLENFTGLAEQAFNQAYVDNLAPGLIYLTAGKGLFKTVDEGKNWQKLELPGKHSPELPTRPVAVARSSSNIVFTGVGNVIYKSTDGGATWQTQSIVTNGFVNYILIDPQLPQVVYAGNFVEQ